MVANMMVNKKEVVMKLLGNQAKGKLSDNHKRPTNNHDGDSLIANQSDKKTQGEVDHNKQAMHSISNANG